MAKNTDSAELNNLTLSELAELLASGENKLGIVLGLEQVATDILKQAGVAFQEGQDEKANSLREFSRVYSGKSEKLRKEYEANLKPQRAAIMHIFAERHLQAQASS